MAGQNSSLSPPPIQTPITAQGPNSEGIPFNSRPENNPDATPSGNINVSWAQWFNILYQYVLTGGSIVSGAAAYSIPVSGGTAQPDFARSNVQQVTLAVTTALSQALHLPSGVFVWLLYVDNPTATPLALIPDASYLTGAAIILAAGTRTILSCSTTQSGNTAITNALANQPIGTI